MIFKVHITARQRALWHAASTKSTPRYKCAHGRWYARCALCKARKAALATEPITNSEHTHGSLLSAIDIDTEESPDDN
jgi:hypothetical protein